MKRIGIVISCAFLANLTSAQTSELVLTSTSNTECYVVQGGQVIRQFTRTGPYDGTGVVVQNTIKMIGRAGGNVGRQYDHNGNLLAGHYLNTGFVDCYDGATNGAHNWTISHNDFSNNFAVLISDGSWGSMQIAFVPNRRSSGIAYDATDDTLWISNNYGGCDRIQHYSTTGNLLGEYPITPLNGGGYGIALDPADQTLWMPGGYFTQGQIFQYDKSGTLLQTLTIAGMNADITGAEFDAHVPVVTYCTAGTTLNNCLASISASGVPSVGAASGFVVNVNHVEGQKQGIIFYGVSVDIASPWGSSTSLLCVKAPLQRTGVQNSGGTLNACDGALTLNLFGYASTHPTALGTPFSSGQTAFLQGWFRDQGSPKTTSLSDALAVTFLP